MVRHEWGRLPPHRDVGNEPRLRRGEGVITLTKAPLRERKNDASDLAQGVDVDLDTRSQWRSSGLPHSWLVARWVILAFGPAAWVAPVLQWRSSL